jgi:general secretion pathway protein I
MSRDRDRRRGADGFTLLEVLIAFIIAALALGLMFDASIGGLRASETASHYQEALSLARSHLASITTTGLTGREESGDDGRGFHFSVRVRPVGTATLPRAPNADPAQGTAPRVTLYSVSVTESWKGDGGERRVRLDSARLGGGAARGG